MTSNFRLGTERILALTLLLCQSVAVAQYAELRPIVAAANPIVRAAASGGSIVQVGPVQLTFPKDWKFFPDTIGTKAIGPGGAVVDILVLERPSGQSTQLPDPKTSIHKALAYFCSAQSKSQVELLAAAGNHDTYVGSCVAAKNSEEGSYTFIHEVRYRNRIIQMIHSGTGSVSTARARQNSIASSAVLE